MIRTAPLGTTTLKEFAVTTIGVPVTCSIATPVRFPSRRACSDFKVTVIVCAWLGSIMSGEHFRGPLQSGAQQLTPQSFVTPRLLTRVIFHPVSKNGTKRDKQAWHHPVEAGCE